MTTQQDGPSEDLARLYALDAATWAAVNERQAQQAEVGRAALADRIARRAHESRVDEAQRTHEARLADIRRQIELVEAELDLRLAYDAVRPSVIDADETGPLPVPSTGPVPDPTSVLTDPRDRELVTQIKAWIADPEDPGPTGEAVRLRYRIAKGKALELLREARA